MPRQNAKLTRSKAARDAFYQQHMDPRLAPRVPMPDIVRRYRAAADYTVRGFERAVGPGIPIPQAVRDVVVMERHFGPPPVASPLELFVAADAFARRGIKCRGGIGVYVTLPGLPGRSFSELTLRKNLYRLATAIAPWGALGTYYVQTIIPGQNAANGAAARTGIPVSYAIDKPHRRAPAFKRKPRIPVALRIDALRFTASGAAGRRRRRPKVVHPESLAAVPRPRQYTCPLCRAPANTLTRLRIHVQQCGA
jgi:hypothetical protein